MGKNTIKIKLRKKTGVRRGKRVKPLPGTGGSKMLGQHGAPVVPVMSATPPTCPKRCSNNKGKNMLSMSSDTRRYLAGQLLTLNRQIINSD